MTRHAVRWAGERTRGERGRRSSLTNRSVQVYRVDAAPLWVPIVTGVAVSTLPSPTPSAPFRRCFSWLAMPGPPPRCLPPPAGFQPEAAQAPGAGRGRQAAGHGLRAGDRPDPEGGRAEGVGAGTGGGWCGWEKDGGMGVWGKGVGVGRGCYWGSGGLVGARGRLRETRKVQGVGEAVA